MGCVNPNQRKKEGKQLPSDRVDFLRNTSLNSFPSQITPNNQFPKINENNQGNGEGDDPIIIDDDFEKSHIATSKIYRRSSSISKRGSKQKAPEEQQQEVQAQNIFQNQPNSIMLGVQPSSQEELMEGVIKEEIGYSEIHIYTPSMAMEFSIPKSYAGPLIIPFVNYHQYQKEIQYQ